MAQEPPLLSSTEIRPQPTYQAHPSSPLPANIPLYNRLASAPRRLLTSHLLAPRSGLAFAVPRTTILRISTPEGPQVGDLNLWSLDNPRERFWASRTRQLHASHIGKWNRLWSCLPYLRPMVTVVGDSIGDRLGRDGRSRWGGRCHDLLGTRCDPYVNALLTGAEAGVGGYDFQCHSNLVRAVREWGLEERDVHDVLNVFQVTGLDEQGRYFMEASPARKGDFIEFFAEMDLLCALSTCPGGDLSKWAWGEGEGGDMRDVCRPLKIEIFEVTGRENVLEGWEEPVPMWKKYRGMHGMKIPGGETEAMT
ncbi:hypothetical protein EV356DRAFT_452008 [Viridothelium virens]|uniref:DUF1989 domain-containing protein n=1 Tax=Viridothelium virens TaxID=1048519 RepID=A0A6A6H0P2_VIRVR|nr:hypothetical protein EV356DRAFT_452008 [Viridothelium virens]